MPTTLSCDVLVIGGGINGTGIARDAAGRGLRVILCEKDDLAGHTSSASSKLIHGGLRYLEYFDFHLVRKALQEREILMRAAPHLITPLGFVMPWVPHLRPAWMLSAGLFIYDHLAKRRLLPASYPIRLRQHEAGLALKADLQKAFVYADGWVDDARLVVTNALDAAERGGTIFTQTTCTEIRQTDNTWQVRVQKRGAGKPEQTLHIHARSLVNASGAWASQLQTMSHAHTSPSLTAEAPARHLRLIKGSHIVVPRLFEHAFAYLLQHDDGRIVFAIPYEGAFTLIGTTDLDYQGDMNQVRISAEEIEYLCTLSNHFFKQQISARDVVHSYSGVRPLVDDGATDAKAITRDYRLHLEKNGAPALHVFGGKITTYRKLAEEAVNLLAPLLHNYQKAWTDRAILPGGDLLHSNDALPPHDAAPDAISAISTLIHRAQQRYPWLPKALLKRYAHSYGSRLHQLLLLCESLADLGAEILPGLYEREVRYLLRHEWAIHADDILWRRSKLGLHLPADASAQLDAWIKQFA